MKEMKKDSFLMLGMLAILVFGMVATSCGTLWQAFWPPYAIDKNGQLFLGRYDDVLIGDGNVIGVTINGAHYATFSMIKAPASVAEKRAIQDSIYSDAPEGWTHYIPGKLLVWPKKPNYTPPPPPEPVPTPPPSPQPRSIDNPTITPEELEKVELAYAETIRDIERRGRRLRIRNRSERAAFIQHWQGKPDTEQVDATRQEAFPWYTTGYIQDTEKTMINASEKHIVAMAKNEPNDFRKVRMIHDWVGDIFAYDYDLLWWMDNVSHRNEEFTLGQLIERERGVCLEYAILFYYLMDAAGIETYLISEVIDPENAHAYNMVVINETGYVIDTTWDSGNKYEGGKITRWELTWNKT
jgi:transglutaminase-like putative cysteine protease